MKVYQIPVGPMQNFSYIVEDESTHEAIVIDPSWDLEKLTDEELAKELSVKIVQHDASDLKNDLTVSDGDSIKFGCSELAVYHTPGHSKDSICLVGDGKIFSGDTLFVGNCGRIDLPGGSSRELYHSLFDVIANLSDDLVLYPGHNYGSDVTSTIGSEKRTNLVMQKVSEAEFVERMGG